MIKRTDTHITDTLAVRTIISTIPPDWLIRGMDERDYGIDLAVELFDDEKPTGCTAMIQVKGTRSPFPSPVKLRFPTKTLEYAELFSMPFFIFHTSITDQSTRFVWVQKYIDTYLNKSDKNWRSKKTITITFPAENVIGDSAGNAKMEKIMRLIAAEKSGLKFLSDFEWLAMHWEHYRCGQVAILPQCVERARLICERKEFLAVYNHGFLEFEPSELVAAMAAFHEKSRLDLHELSYTDAKALSHIDMLLGRLKSLKILFLDQAEMDLFEEEYSSSSPY